MFNLVSNRCSAKCVLGIGSLTFYFLNDLMARLVAAEGGAEASIHEYELLKSKIQHGGAETSKTLDSAAGASPWYARLIFDSRLGPT
jgi:hypothetical protein